MARRTGGRAITARQVTATRRRAIPPASALVALAFMLLVVAWSLLFSNLGGIIIAAVYALPGLFLALRRPGQPLAWLLLLTGLGLALGTTVPTASAEALLAGEADTLGRLTAWGTIAGWVLFFAGFLGILLTFPSGRLPGGRWRAVSFALIAIITICGGLIVLGPTLDVDVPGRPTPVSIPNPFGLPLLAQLDEDAPGVALLFPMLLVCQVVALVGMVARSRRSTGPERLQYRWLASAVAVVVLGIFLWMVVALIVQTDLVLLPAIILGLTFPAIPIAVVIAVLRYRLYEIDRLVSRTLGWALATATVVGVFGLTVIALQAALAGVTQSGTLAVAASTLLAFALFQPLRRRVQRVVDQRFDRPRLEVERVLTRHGDRLRHEMDLATIEAGMLETVSGTVRPTSAVLWVRTRRDAARS